MPLVPPHDVRCWLMMQPTRVLTMNPGPIEPESETGAFRLEFDAGAGMLVGFRGSIQAPPQVGLDSDAWLSALEFRMWFNDEESVTVGTHDAVSGQLSLGNGWTSYENCFSRQDVTYFPFWRWVIPSDRLYVAFRNRSTWPAPLEPTMTWGMVRERDYYGPDPRWPG